MIQQSLVTGLFIIFVSLAGQSCRSSHSSGSQQAMYKSIYVDQFLLTYFQKILIKSYNNSRSIQEIINNDHSGFTEPILTTEDYKLIDSLTTIDNSKMQVDSINGNRRAEGAQGKRPLLYVLNKLRSKWLDSLANERYKHSGVKRRYRE